MSPAIRPITHASTEYDAAVDLRRRVLRTPLGLDFTADQLASEDQDTHLAAFLGEVLIGSVTLTPYDATTFKLRQMAVSPEHQGLGLGARLLVAAENHVRGVGAGRIVLAARVTAQPFYEKYGYARDGDVFTEVTLPHIHMHKVMD